jgi:hypothetical protein
MPLGCAANGEVGVVKRRHKYSDDMVTAQEFESRFPL